MIFKSKRYLKIRKKIFYELDQQGEIKTYQNWLGDSFAFLYDFFMERNVFPKKFKASMELHNQFWKDELKNVQNKRVLELGTGSGASSFWLENSNDYHGVDISPNLMKRAVSKFEKAKFHKPSFYILDSVNLPFVDNCFDDCLCILTMNFFDDAEKVIKEASRVIKTDGIFYACVPVPERKSEKSKISGKLFTEQEWQQIFKKYGFRFRTNNLKNGAVLYFSAIKQ